MKEVSVRGTLGDTYIALLKIKTMINQPVKVYHHTKHIYWYRLIEEIYNLYVNVNVVFVNEPRLDLEEITSDCHEGEMEFFPLFDIWDNFRFEKPFNIIQPHSGKSVGFNTKKIPKYIIKNMISKSPIKCVLLGTDTEYVDINNCINLVGKTSIKDVVSLIYNCNEFIGIEGLLSFIALSQKKSSIIYYTEPEAVEKRIIDTPWEKYANLIPRTIDSSNYIL